MNWSFLVVDDNEADRVATAAALSRIVPGATVLGAGTRAGAIAMLEESRTVPSLILLDYDLGEATGVDVFGDIRTRHWLDRAPVIFLSAPVDDRQLMVCYRMGALTFLSKPVHQFELRQAVREFAREAQPLHSAAVYTGLGARRTAA
jgi:CheY-like chemotaxis protein